jgi:hypothetical protein
MEHVGVALRRGLSRTAGKRLAPLNPDSFLVWVWMQGDRAKGTAPLTVEDVGFELRQDEREVHRDYVRLAAKVRRNQRLGLDPWEGI